MPGVVQNAEGCKDGEALHQGQQLAMARGEQRESDAAELFSTQRLLFADEQLLSSDFTDIRKRISGKGGFGEALKALSLSAQGAAGEAAQKPLAENLTDE